MHALVHEGKVVQVEEEPFPVHPSLTWVNLDGHEVVPEYGWLYSDGKFVPPPEPPEPVAPEPPRPSRQELLEGLVLKVADLVLGKVGKAEVKTALQGYKVVAANEAGPLET